MIKGLLLLVATVLVFGNIFAFAALYILTGANMYGEDYAAYKATLEKSKEAVCLVPHPFFGQLTCDDVALNTPISGKEPLLRAVSKSAAKNPVRVLVLGGSVAGHLSKNVSSNKKIPPAVDYAGEMLGYEHILQTVLNRHFDTNRFEVHNAAFGGGKQPQQLFKLQYLLMLGERYDVVLNVDGFNEIALPLMENRDLGNFVAYPRSYSRLVESASSASSAACLKRANHYARHSSAHPLSEAAHLAYIKWCHREVEQVSLAADNPVAKASGYVRQSDEETIAEEVALWQQASESIARLAPAYGFAYIHAIQPNQYVQGSKPLSAKEQEKFLALDRYGDPIRAYYSRLGFDTWPQVASTTRLDLREVFKEHPETLYRDACCHLSNKGMALMAESIAAQAEPVFAAALKAD